MSVRESKNLDTLSVDVSRMEEQHWNEEKESIGMVFILLKLQRRWKQIFLITAIGAAITIAMIMSMPQVYRAKAQVSLPQKADISMVTENGLDSFEPKEIFKLFYNKIRSEAFLLEYLRDTGYLQRLYPKKDVVETEGKLFKRFVDTFVVKIDEPVLEKNAYVEFPTQFSLSVEHRDEELIVDLLNNYLAYSNKALIDKLAVEQKTERNTKLKLLEREIEGLRATERKRRELEIAKIEAENNVVISSLEQRKSLLISQAEGERKAEIEKIVEENQRKIEQLEQKKKLLVEKAENDRRVKVAQIKEALAMAKSLGIEYPTQLENLGKQKQGASGTNIIVNNNQELPTYLMGTRYLKTLISTLENRENDAAFLEELNELDEQIALIKNDVRLKTLQQRKSDEPFIKELNEINSEIKRVKNDVKLVGLRSRASDDPYIDGLPQLVRKADELRSLSMDFSGSKAYTLDKSAFVSAKSVKPNRVLLLFIGLSLSLFIAVAVVLFNNAADELRKSGRLNESALK